MTAPVLEVIVMHSLFSKFGLYELYFLSRVQTYRINYLPRIHQIVLGDTAAVMHVIFARQMAHLLLALDYLPLLNLVCSTISQQPTNNQGLSDQNSQATQTFLGCIEIAMTPRWCRARLKGTHTLPWALLLYE